MNIWCVGRNYSEHAQELGNAIPETPLIFLKAGSCLVHSSIIELPKWTQEVHHELELAFQFNQELHLDKAALALDLTERQLQSQLKSKGQPWTLAKSFTGACPMSESKSLSDLRGLKTIYEWEFSLEVNGKIRQKARMGEMIFNLEILETYVKSRFPIAPMDWLLTGTPAGVAALKEGDQLVARWGAFPEQKWRVQSS